MMITQKYNHFNKSSVEGFTLIESLVAIVVLSVLLISTSPIIAFSVGTRAQAKRIELGSLAARGYIDALRAANGCTKTTAADDTCILNPPKTISNNAQPSNNPPANSSLTCPTSGDYCNTPNDVYCVDGDGDGQCQNSSLADMVVQAVAYGGSDSDHTKGYKLLVRVYRADAFKTGVGSLLTGQQQSTITTAVGNVKAPVVQMSTEIPPSKLDFNQYNNLLK